ncbi:class I SAM-dependent methyltransferase [Motilibacter deserti]|uniref:Class I SAM-dependent methyltransferase n=1 Tax=Motilibacter deserti TaxID=2714956 RepID=A0ABX0GY24_9ACTN|nr:class I SAM-dependent methyltransferase [Motilibacter deserti]NHC15727.1 class I SAM-dependent methyltransferase [Motilibacter deserti]
MSSARVAQAYAALAERYIELLGSVESVHPDDLRLLDDHLARLTGPVLDLGCGPGHLSGYLRRAGVDVTGIDLVPEFLAHARQAHPSVRFELGSLTELDRPDASVAGVLAWFSLIHLEPGELDASLAGIRRVLAPESPFVVGFFAGDACEPFPHKVAEAYRWPADEVARRLARAGFMEVERVQRPPDGERRAYAVIAARAVAAS